MTNHPHLSPTEIAELKRVIDSTIATGGIWAGIDVHKLHKLIATVEALQAAQISDGRLLETMRQGLSEKIADLTILRRQLAQANAEIERLRAACDWQPIDTAPIDGTKVDLWCRSPGLSSGPARIPDCWYSSGKWWCHDDYGDDQGRSEVRAAKFWRPIPEMPRGA